MTSLGHITGRPTQKTALLVCGGCQSIAPPHSSRVQCALNPFRIDRRVETVWLLSCAPCSCCRLRSSASGQRKSNEARARYGAEEEEFGILHVRIGVHLHGGVAALPRRLDVHQRARRPGGHAPPGHVQESRAHPALVRQGNHFPYTFSFCLNNKRAPPALNKVRKHSSAIRTMWTDHYRRFLLQVYKTSIEKQRLALFFFRLNINANNVFRCGGTSEKLPAVW